MTDPRPPVLLDFESRSRADLKKIGGRLYWEHASSEALCCAWYDVESGEVGVWLPGQQWPHYGRTLAAHNAMGFDRWAAQRLGWVDADSGREMIDTSELARRAGYPGALDALGTRLLGVPKDKEASRFTKSLSQVRRPCGKKNPDAISAANWAAMNDEERAARGVQTPITPEVLSRVVPYCLSDVQIMALAWPDLSGWMGLEDDVERVDRVVNDRGVYFDAELARALLVCDRQNADRVIADVAEQLWSTSDEVRADAMSPKRFCSVTGSENAQKTLVSELDHPLARARQALASIASGKLTAGLARMSTDSRLRDTLRYYGAATGRWSGRGMQLQNMPRPAKRFEKFFEDNDFDEAQIDAWIDALARGVTAGRRVADPEEIDLLVRATICAPPGKTLAVCDFSGVEARALAWVAHDDRAVQVFLSKVDVYKNTAAHVFGIPYDRVSKEQRTLGKVLELACLAWDTRVVTRRGPLRIVDVALDDEIWDGDNWVAHGGLVYRGDRYCADFHGARMTLDHSIWCGRHGWCDAATVARYDDLLAAAYEKRADRPEFGRLTRQTTWDIAHAGPLNRFTILTDAGPLIVHNCGYGQGGKKFAETAAKMGADLDAVGVNSFEAVAAWRELHAPIVWFWGDAEDAFVRAMRGETAQLDRFTFAPSSDGKDVAIFLPSGRPIVYPDVRMGTRVMQTKRGDREMPSITIPGLKGPEHLYGGLIVENMIQGMCRDLMADALVRAERAGLNPVLHVHDEIVCEVDERAGQEAFRELREIMTTWPEWAAGFPGDAAGFVGRRYRK